MGLRTLLSAQHTVQLTPESSGSLIASWQPNAGVGLQARPVPPLLPSLAVGAPPSALCWGGAAGCSRLLLLLGSVLGSPGRRMHPK